MQPPPGYPQGQQNPQFMPSNRPQQPAQPQQYPQQQPYPQQYAPQQQYPPQYQQYPYYPPQKSGMPGWAWGLIIGGIVLFVILPIMALAAIPLITSNTREARRAEGEQLLNSARDATRIQYSKTGIPPARISDFTEPYLFEGLYYAVDDNVTSTGTSGTITCAPLQTTSDGRGRIDFQWASGESRVQWN